MPFQEMIAKAILKLPPSWLYRMSGGEPLQIDGRTLDPHFQAIAQGSKGQPALYELSVEEARALSAAGAAAFAAKPEDGVAIEDIVISANGRNIPARTYAPDVQNPAAPLMVYAHLGGGVLGDLDHADAFCSVIASIAQTPVVSIEYRLAPENRWPAGLEDFIDAYFWALGHAEHYGAPPGRASVGGDSMGGNFAAIACQEAKRRGAPLPELQLLIYPAVDMQSETRSMEVFGDVYPLRAETMRWFMSHYKPNGVDASDVRISPMNETDLSDLPPAIVVTAGFDPLVDQGALYAERLSAAGVQVRFRCYDSLAHGFTAFMGASPGADRACREIARLVRDASA